MQTKSVGLPGFKLCETTIRVQGDSPLICHRFGASQRKSILDKQTKKARHSKGARDPEREFRESLYELGKDDNGNIVYGFPSSAFKKAAVFAIRHVEGMTMAGSWGSFHVLGEYVRIHGDGPHVREDIIRLPTGAADIRFRAEFRDWYCDVPVSFNEGSISLEQLGHLFNVAGFAVGVGDWRPERRGSYGMFHVVSQEEPS